MSDNKFYKSLVNYFHKPYKKRNKLIFRKFCPRYKKQRSVVNWLGIVAKVMASLRQFRSLFKEPSLIVTVT